MTAVPVGQLRQSISLIAKVFLAMPDTPLTSAHSIYLGPYYSVTGSGAFLQQLIALANAVASREQNDRDAKRVIRNLEEWADGIFSTEKEILLEAITRRSHFAFDMIFWITRVTTTLVFVSNAPACDDHARGELREHALWLVSTLSFIPDDIETVKFVESFGLTERLFETALEFYRRECPNLAERVSNLLVSWMFKAGRHSSGWAILEKSIYGAATLALLAEAEKGGATVFSWSPEVGWSQPRWNPAVLGIFLLVRLGRDHRSWLLVVSRAQRTEPWHTYGSSFRRYQTNFAATATG
jgi:hypothetical protein